QISFNKQLEDLDIVIKSNLRGLKTVDFAMLFATKEKEMAKAMDKLGPKLNGDAVFWLCYPKKSSKKYKADSNRDSEWKMMGKFELEGVHMVAIDKDWSALRFRKVDYIKTMKRKFKTLTEKGRKKTEGNN
ncbi:MAG: hypothetical protein AAGK97_05505, partial [Bacteroidota bacterium]